MTTSQHQITPESVLKQYWGYPAFRPMQREIIQHVLDGDDLLVILPTGGGKSICYQVPALLSDGVCLVISPLVALMQDQVTQLQQRGIKAEAIYAGLPRSAIDRILDNCVFGDIKLLYMSPERLQTDLARERITRMNLSLIAVDEAHCISQWGHDFRPAYLEIAQVRTWQPGVPVLALTATATPAVAQDVITHLEIGNEQEIRGGFVRPNLSYLVYEREDKITRLIESLKKIGGSGLVYVRSRRKARELAELLVRSGIRSAPYHAGMAYTVRESVQKEWLAGATPVVVCTTAFGMGIDKPDVRLVVHYDIPASPEEYYQEAGRAGRDGLEAYCVLLYNRADIRQMEKRWTEQYPDAEVLSRIYRALMSYAQLPIGTGKGALIALDVGVFAQRYGLGGMEAYHGLKGLERAGWIVLNEAMHHPARVQFLLQKEDLYRYQVERPEFDPLTKTLLRSHEGMFLEPVAIRETDLARRLGIPAETLDQWLMALEQDRVIRYERASDVPRVIMLYDRVSAENLGLDSAHVMQMRKAARVRMDGMIAFLGETECRQQALLRYFGDADDAFCEKCDLCRKRADSVTQQQVTTMIPGDGIGIRELLNAFPSSVADRVRKYLQTLESEEQIEVRGGMIFPVQAKSHD